MSPDRRLPYPDDVLAHRPRLGLRIAMLRRAARLSQDGLAERTFVSRQSIMRWENGTRDPRYLDLVALAAALNITVSELVDLDADLVR
ncbi:helix-turn-helix domain-containing protein [Streptomyces sp. NBC_01077]|uniref:helix-turn-helix transcriptional regulator n=1 Tax=Streptomyces sp. NBC_01077 TaxID=2903746 RepID=UPI00386BB311|nr:helix-turn-helix domain-containing protein [Streptomyces sp. NBC_01077]